MPTFYIRTINHHFEARDDGRDYEDLGHGRRAAIAAAAEIAVEELSSGRNPVIVESRVESDDGTVRAKLVVSMSFGDVKP